MLAGLIAIAAGRSKEAPAPLCQFVVVDVRTLLLIAAGWELVYQLAKRAHHDGHRNVVSRICRAGLCGARAARLQ